VERLERDLEGFRDTIKARDTKVRTLEDTTRAREAQIRTLEGRLRDRDAELSIAREMGSTVAALEIDLRDLEDKERASRHQLAEMQKAVTKANATAAAAQSAALHAEVLRHKDDAISKSNLQIIQDKYAGHRARAHKAETDLAAAQQELQALRSAHRDELKAKAAAYDKVNSMLEGEQCDRAEACAELKRLSGERAAMLKVQYLNCFALLLCVAVRMQL
jgi:chromosome segregation ATPase